MRTGLHLSAGLVRIEGDQRARPTRGLRGSAESLAWATGQRSVAAPRLAPTAPRYEHLPPLARRSREVTMPA